MPRQIARAPAGLEVSREKGALPPGGKPWGKASVLLKTTAIPVICFETASAVK